MKRLGQTLVSLTTFCIRGEHAVCKLTWQPCTCPCHEVLSPEAKAENDELAQKIKATRDRLKAVRRERA